MERLADTSEALREERDATFLSIFKGNMNSVYRFARRLLNDPEGAEDASQEVFLKLYQSLQDGVRISNPSSWLMTTTRNHCLNRLRRTRRELPLETRHTQIGVDRRGTLEAKHHFDAALAELDMRQREALLLRVVEGFSYAEIAEITNSTAAAVRSVLYRARQELRCVLQKMAEQG